MNVPESRVERRVAPTPKIGLWRKLPSKNARGFRIFAVRMDHSAKSLDARIHAIAPTARRASVPTDQSQVFGGVFRQESRRKSEH